MLEQVDGMVVGGGLLALALLAYIRRLARNPVDKVEVRPGPIDQLGELRGRVKAWREVRANRRRAQALARIDLRHVGGAAVRDTYTITERPADPPAMRRRSE